MRRVALLTLVVVTAADARAACPCYSVSATPNTYNCGVEAAPGTNPDVATWQGIFQIVAGGPASWGAGGPAITPLPSGCGAPTPPGTSAAVFPCELMKAIAMNESGWRQFCVPTAPANKAGPPERTIIAVDCGYGVGQITSGMHVGETPAYDRARVASDPTYNLATGAQILGGKWRATKCVGDRMPAVVEDWYTATWAYNGLAAKNDPNYASYDAMRPVCDPNVSCPNRPYQERVWGWMEHPPSDGRWASLAPAYPDRGSITYNAAGQPLAMPEPSCAGPTDCANKRSVHVSGCLGAPPPDGGVDAGALDSDGGGASDSDGGDGGGHPGGCGCDLGARAPRNFFGVLLAALCACGLRRARRLR